MFCGSSYAVCFCTVHPLNPRGARVFYFLYCLVQCCAELCWPVCVPSVRCSFPSFALVGALCCFLFLDACLWVWLPAVVFCCPFWALMPLSGRVAGCPVVLCFGVPCCGFLLPGAVSCGAVLPCAAVLLGSAFFFCFAAFFCCFSLPFKYTAKTFKMFLFLLFR